MPNEPEQTSETGVLCAQDGCDERATHGLFLLNTEVFWPRCGAHPARPANKYEVVLAITTVIWHTEA